MISPEEAWQILLSNVKFFQQKKSVKVRNAAGYLLANDIYSPLHLPPFNQSNVDGYAVKFSSEEMTERKFILQGEIKAGDSFTGKLKKGEARPVYTGAIVPANADAVVMQENTEVRDNILHIAQSKIAPGDLIRLKGSQIKKGELAMKKKTRLTPGAIGFLYAMGIEKVSVFKWPVISILITGNELQAPGKRLKPGKVYESNSATLAAALEREGFNVHKIKLVKDEKQEVKKAVKKLLPDTDVLLISGGISVGKYDYVKTVVAELKVKELFHTVAQRPGKPLYFGRQKNKLVFALPGNPSSALTCFYEYVFPALNVMTGRKQVFLKKETHKLLNDFKTVPHLSYFVRGRTEGDEVTALEGAESYKMKAYTDANCLLYLPKGKEKAAMGDMVEVHLLPV